ncbi:pilus assembly protein TadG-related protein [Pseudomonas sp. GX19020]|uniref:pilus assembly protein TadG-related protein n=1 Tax=Pseudomonas sp. GX19020 TaxID=2942277 RepID=UPI002018E3FA|nr:pilus assembly protein TadG-related protein [Pseudomonas sp. GX19020]MCL4068815.1 pilus assembly protein TadG-related protein [Pseudomonas sp. GX19020]
MKRSLREQSRRIGPWRAFCAPDDEMHSNAHETFLASISEGRFGSMGGVTMQDAINGCICAGQTYSGRNCAPPLTFYRLEMHFYHRFASDTSGALSILLVVLLPLILLVGGVATDIAQLNAQKRYVQSQADLAALTSSKYLPNKAAVRENARQTVTSNDRYGSISLSDSSFEFGYIASDTGKFVRDELAARPSAVKVIVPSKFNPILLGPVLDEKNIIIRRAAVGAKRGLVVFSLRNRLLSVDTNRSLLGPALSKIGLQLNGEVLGPNGLASAGVRLDELLGGLINSGVGLDALTFDNLLNAQVNKVHLLARLLALSNVGNIALNPTPVGSGNTTFADILNISPKLLGVKAGKILHDVRINAFDMAMAFVGLWPPSGTLIESSVNLNLGRLANVNVGLYLGDPPKIAIGHVDDFPPLSARMAQIGATVKAAVLNIGEANLLDVTLNLSAATAEATIVSLNCAATDDSDLMALFDVNTSVLNLSLTVGLLDTRANIPPDTKKISLGGKPVQVRVLKGQVGKAVPVKTRNMNVTGLISDTADYLRATRDDLREQVRTCRGLLVALLCAIVNTVNVVLGALLGVLAALADSIARLLQNLGVDEFIQLLLDILGIGVAQADLVLHSVSCDSYLAQ